MSEISSIRPLTFEDLPTVLVWRNHPNIRRHMLTQHEIRLDEHQNWFAKVCQDATRRLMIVEEANIPIGYIQMSNVGDGEVSNWGFYVSPNAPKGSGRKLGIAALNYAFNHLCVHKVWGQVLESNEGSIALHKYLGFTQEGILREQSRINGQYLNLICFGLLKNEWLPERLFKELKNARN